MLDLVLVPGAATDVNLDRGPGPIVGEADEGVERVTRPGAMVRPVAAGPGGGSGGEGRPGPKNPLKTPSHMWSLWLDYPCSAWVSPDSRQPLLESLVHHPDERVPVLLPDDKAIEDRQADEAPPDRHLMQDGLADLGVEELELEANAAMEVPGHLRVSRLDGPDEIGGGPAADAQLPGQGEQGRLVRRYVDERVSATLAEAVPVLFVARDRVSIPGAQLLACQGIEQPRMDLAEVLLDDLRAVDPEGFPVLL
jgi:hypothetical protein